MRRCERVHGARARTVRCRDGNLHKLTGTLQVRLSLGIHAVGGGPASLRSGRGGEESGNPVGTITYSVCYRGGPGSRPDRDLLFPTYSARMRTRTVLFDVGVFTTGRGSQPLIDK